MFYWTVINKDFVQER